MAKLIIRTIKTKLRGKPTSEASEAFKNILKYYGGRKKAYSTAQKTLGIDTPVRYTRFAPGEGAENYRAIQGAGLGRRALGKGTKW